jgi:hypothetical protein
VKGCKEVGEGGVLCVETEQKMISLGCHCSTIAPLTNV